MGEVGVRRRDQMTYPSRVVQALVRLWVVRRGRRNWVDQPAPRIRMSTAAGCGGEGGGVWVVMVVGWVDCVIFGGWRRGGRCVWGG